ncbi:hypothetical protein LNN31_10245 [Acetobacterium wieringae]|uniref:Uncharacterized protein n=1 Tax=Acetobacterium wieringae TaxID=52694 RepID=A0ABY6H9K0_9FIRM|nr:hypothetical protein [Acetobacterium wieringae]UYO61165.1 hypothetical protein LNN31_10245 [Acetobacterium wieringae]VUZ24433.1 Uncharacterised protein [Acetobacterium wieringae]
MEQKKAVDHPDNRREAIRVGEFGDPEKEGCHAERNVQKLLERSDDWLKYAIQINLCNKEKATLVDLRKAALADERIQGYLADVADFHGSLVTNHKNPDLPIHKLLFLLDLGFDLDVPEIKKAVAQILKHRDEKGIFQSKTNVPKRYGGAGVDVFSWCLCDAPLLLLALLKAGINYQEAIKPGVDQLVSLCRDNGFPCAVSPELGKFRGPGRKNDCCPYATLIMADLLSYIPEYRDSEAAITAVNALLSLWENSREQHPYQFYMGTDFRKLKAPSCWYDIVSVAGVLSNYQFVRDDPRFREMIAIISAKQDQDGLYTPESAYQKLKGWDCGQKKVPSPYLSYRCALIRSGRNWW